VDLVDGTSAVADVTAGLSVLMAAGVAAIALSIVRGPVGRSCGFSAQAGSSTPRRSGLSFVGRWVRAMLGQPANAVLDRVVGRAMVVVAVMAFIHVGLAVLVSFTIWGHSMVRRRRTARQHEEKVSAGLADVIDLFAVALLSGNTVAEATEQVCEWSEGDFADAFAWCNRRVSTGLPLSDVLESLPARLGQQTRPLIAALVSTERYGAPIAANLAQLAAETRSDRRRQAEASARRLPVELLFPLVVCVLPAFLLVTVVPVIVETVSNLQITASP